VEELSGVSPPAQWDGDGVGAFPVAKLAPSPSPAAIEKSLDVETLVEGRHAGIVIYAGKPELPPTNY
jgi:hypothetical protein